MQTLSIKKPSVSTANNRLFFVHALLMGFHVLLLIGFIGYQFAQPLFLNATTWIWAYLCLFLCFIFDFLYFYPRVSGSQSGGLDGAPQGGGLDEALISDRPSEIRAGATAWGGLLHELWLALDTVLITLCLSMALPALSSVLLFVYMLSIFGAGLIGQYKGAFAQGLLVSFLFSSLLVLQPAFAESYPSLVFAFVLNNIGFMSVASLSGFFGVQAMKKDWLIGMGDRVSWDLENLNKLIVENMSMGLFILDEDTHIIHSNNQARRLLNLPEGFSAPIHQLFPEMREYLISPKDGVCRFPLKYNEAGSAYEAGSARRVVDPDYRSPIKDIEVFISPIKNYNQNYMWGFEPSPCHSHPGSPYHKGVDVSPPDKGGTRLEGGQGGSLKATHRGTINEKNQANKYLVLFQDMTQVRRREKQEQEKEKLAGIGRMAIGIAHEIRNPLSSVGGSIQLLDLDNKNPPENKRLMDIALREISRLNGIIGEFLSYTSDESALKNLPTEPVEINVVLEELLDSVRVNPHWDHIKHHALLKAHGLVEGRADKFKQIFWNLVKNGCEAMSHQKEGCLTLESFDDNEWVVVRIKDTGCGISDKDKPYIYEPFYSSQREKGSGLGLAIARKLILFYKGSISHQAQDKGGTLFEVRFPLQSNPLPGEMAAQKAS